MSSETLEMFEKKSLKVSYRPFYEKLGNHSKMKITINFLFLVLLKKIISGEENCCMVK